MKLGAYQFPVAKSIKDNLETVKKAIIKASHEGVKLLVFPECALTGYPPRDFENSSVVNFQELNFAYKQLQSLVDENAIHIIIGTIIQKDKKYYNSAVVIVSFVTSKHVKDA